MARGVRGMRGCGVKAAAAERDESGDDEMMTMMPEGVPPPDVASLAQLARIRVTEDEVRGCIAKCILKR